MSAALGPLLTGGRPAGDALLGDVVTDSRALKAGDVFVALRGERFDGHDFVAQAAERGVRAVVVSTPPAVGTAGIAVFVVDDTVAALGRLGTYRRRAWAQGGGGCVIAVAGSNGKTTTKEFIAAALRGSEDAPEYAVHATRGNLNNHIGVPLTLLSIPDEAQIAVIEVGTNHPGEIATLRDIVQPDVAVVTSIGEEHLEGLGSLEGVLQEECAILNDVALAVVPSAYPDVVAIARQRAQHVISAGTADAEIAPTAWGLGSDGRAWLELTDDEGIERVTLPVVGAHNVSNALLAIGVARAVGIAPRLALRALGAAVVPGMRSALVTLGEMTIYHDAYNANPASAREALRTFDSMGGTGQQRVIVLGSMLELGPSSAALHDEIAMLALGTRADLIVGVGEFRGAFARVASGVERVVTGDDIEALAPIVLPRVQRNALVLLKGSRGTRLERLVPLLSAVAGAPAPVGAH